MALKLVLVDDHTLVRQALVKVLAADRDIQVVGEGKNGFDALALAKEFQPDAVLMDLYMPGLDGLAATRLIKREFPNIQVILLSASPKEEDVVEAVRAGARGYIAKTIDSGSFLRQLKQVISGGVALSEDMISKLVTGLAGNGHPQRADQTLYAALTPREKEVLALIAQGKTNKEIASALVVSVNTVRAHVRGLMQKLNLDNRTQLAIYGVREGLGVGTERQTAAVGAAKSMR